MRIVTKFGNIDLSKTFNYSFNYSVKDLTDINSRKGNFTKTIFVPSTPNNDKIFNSFYNIKTDMLSFDNLILDCYVESGGIIYLRGGLELLSVNLNNYGNEYEILIFSEFVNLFDNIQDVNLTDLDFSKYNHKLNLSNIGNANIGFCYVYDNLQRVDKGTGYVYPLADYGGVRDANGYMLAEDLKPALHVKEYIDEIFNLSGISYTSKFFNTDYFKSLLLPFHRGALQVSDSELNDASFTSGDSNYVLQDRGSGVYIYDSLNIINATVIDSSSNYVAPNYTSTVNLEYSIELNGVLNVSLTNNLTNYIPRGDFNTFIYINVIDNADDSIIYTYEIIDYFEYTSNAIFPTETLNSSLTLNANTDSFVMIKGNSYRFELKIRNNDFANPLFGFTDCTFDIDDLEFNVIAEGTDKITYDTKFSFQNAIPNIKTKDFLKDIINMFNLIFYSNPDKQGDFIIESRDEFYNTGKLVDLSNRIDYSQNINTATLRDLVKREYNFTYKEGKDYLNEQYQEDNEKTYGAITVNTGLKGNNSSQTYTLKFAPTIYTEENINDDSYTNIACFKSSADGGEVELNPRIAFNLGRYTYPLSNDGTGLSGDYSDIEMTRMANVDNLNYPNYSLLFNDEVANLDLYNLFYNSEISEITDVNGKKVTAYFNLSGLNLNMNDTVLLNGKNYYISKITDLNPTDLTKVKIELISLKGNVNYLTAEDIIIKAEDDNGLFNDQFNNQFN